MEKILITPRSYAKTDDRPLHILKAAGYQVVMNPYGKILTKEQITELIVDATGIIVGVDPLDEDVLKSAKKLRAIAKYGVGTDNICKSYAQKMGIPISVTSGANSNAVADYAFSLMMACARKIPYINSLCHQKDWSKVIGNDIYGKTLGILGLGEIGKGVAKRATGFDMNVLAYDIFWDSTYAKQHNITYALPEQIFSQCDFISIHLPLNDSTRGMINAEMINKMKNTAVLINTARGGIIDENALVEALKNNRILGAGLDVFEQEPPINQELYKLDNLIMSSHCAASSIGASEAMSLIATENLLRDLDKNR